MRAACSLRRSRGASPRRSASTSAVSAARARTAASSRAMPRRRSQAALRCGHRPPPRPASHRHSLPRTIRSARFSSPAPTNSFPTTTCGRSSPSASCRRSTRSRISTSPSRATSTSFWPRARTSTSRAPKGADGKPAYKLSVNDFVIKALALALNQGAGRERHLDRIRHAQAQARRYRRRGRDRWRPDHARDPQSRKQIARHDLERDEGFSPRAPGRDASSPRNIRAAPRPSPISACTVSRSSTL